MIIVKGSIPVKADHRDEALQLLQLLAERSRVEHGCLAYEIYINADSPETFVIWQQWRGLDALESHFASTHVDEFLEAIPDLIDGDVTSARFEVLSEEQQSGAEDALEQPQVQLADNIVLH